MISLWKDLSFFFERFNKIPPEQSITCRVFQTDDYDQKYNFYIKKIYIYTATHTLMYYLIK